LNRCETGSERLKPEEEAAVREALRQAAEETEQRAAQVRTKLAAGVLLVSVKQGVGTGRKTSQRSRFVGGISKGPYTHG
jgi:hypothetical protein